MLSLKRSIPSTRHYQCFSSSLTSPDICALAMFIHRIRAATPLSLLTLFCTGGRSSPDVGYFPTSTQRSPHVSLPLIQTHLTERQYMEAHEMPCLPGVVLDVGLPALLAIPGPFLLR